MVKHWYMTQRNFVGHTFPIHAQLAMVMCESTFQNKHEICTSNEIQTYQWGFIMELLPEVTKFLPMPARGKSSRKG